MTATAWETQNDNRLESAPVGVAEGAMSHRSLAGVLALCVASWFPAHFAGQQAAPGPALKNSKPPELSASSPNPGEDSLRRFRHALPAEGMADDLRMRLLADHGAILAARGGATPPPTILFADEDAVKNWHATVQSERVEIAGITIELQTPALEALMNARTDARKVHLDITPRASDAARRTYADTVTLWRSRVHPGLRHWVNKGRLTRAEARRIRALPPAAQVPEILRLEAAGLFLGRKFSRSILYSVAPPGASQHIAMLALDIKEHGHRSVRTILARHGWFQTVQFDLPHFAYLGSREDELPALGLKKIMTGDRDFWVLDLAPASGGAK